ncbi:hypothetical protein PPL_09891 [Heterostelium album PN500]|uniref:Ankyrin repeat-containing protein n=1 Tax=Heterostelium pallidum (strain ATCC 26659 / Pp 5 / PN500) TaxID=670386 RepID=D3BPC6_HETP5|nr:hypothetical protein PPL_09891 [Heterostelium album PN500]EFA77136.1 hypothetical protein PPL_09891 [Heterostelium album PN500]|eukprot:XP_020429265.1 hypothetical protein PPL_09891 [Heterostelium album PN500]
MKIVDALCFNIRLLEDAIRCGNLEMFEYLLDHYRLEERISVRDICKTILNELLSHAAEYGRMNITLSLFKRFTDHNWSVSGALIRVPVSGNLELFKFLLVQYDRYTKAPKYADVFDSAARYGRLQMIEWLFSKYTDGHKGSNMFVNAIENGHTHIVEYLLENHRYLFKPDKENYLRAVSKNIGGIDLFIRLYQLGCQCSNIVIGTAAACGNLEVIRWINSNTTIQFHTSTMDIAGRSFQFEVVKWLQENRTEGCSENLLDAVVKKNDLHIVKYLHQHQPEKCSVKAMDRSLKLGHLETAIWLYENRTERFTPGIIKKFIENGKLNVIKWLEENTEERCNYHSLEVAVMFGYLDIIEYLHERNGSKNRYYFSSSTMDLAIKSGDLKIVKWFHENRTDGCSIEALNESLLYRPDGSDLVPWLFANQSELYLESIDIEKQIQFQITMNRHKNLYWLLENFDVSVQQLIQYQNLIGKLKQYFVKGKIFKMFNNQLTKKILDYINPCDLIYRRGMISLSGEDIDPLHYNTYHCHSLINLSLVSWCWFEIVSKLIDKLEISFHKGWKHYEIGIHSFSGTRRINNSLGIPLTTFEKHIRSKSSLLKVNHLRTVIIKNVGFWQEDYNQVLDYILSGDLLSSVVVKSELLSLEPFLSSHRSEKYRFQYYVVPLIMDCNYSSKNVDRIINYLKASENKINTMEIIFDRHPDAVNGLDICLRIEKEFPLSPIHLLQSYGEFYSTIGSFELKPFTNIIKLELHNGYAEDVAKVIKGVPRLKKLMLNIEFNSSDDDEYDRRIYKKMFNALKSHNNINSLTLSISRVEDLDTHYINILSGLSHLLDENQTLTKLNLYCFENINEQLCQSIAQTTRLRSFKITLIRSSMTPKLFEVLKQNRTIRKLTINIAYDFNSEEMDSEIGAIKHEKTLRWNLLKQYPVVLMNYGYLGLLKEYIDRLPKNIDMTILTQYRYILHNLPMVVKFGHLDMLKYLCTFFEGTAWYDALPELLESSIPVKRMDIMEFLFEGVESKHAGYLDRKKMIFLAAQTGSLEIVKYIADKISTTVIQPEQFLRIVEAGHLEIVKHFLETSHMECHPKSAERAALYSRDELILYFSEHFPTTITNATLTILAKNGNVQLLRQLTEKHNMKCSTMALDAAATNGHLEVIKWVFEQDPNIKSQKTLMDIAAAGGYLDIVTFIHNNTTTQCTIRALNTASQQGHLKVVEFLILNRSEGCTPAAFDGAIKNGHLEVLEFLFENRTERPNKNAKEVAASQGHVEILKFLVSRCPEMENTNLFCFNDVATARYIHEELGLPIVEYHIDRALSYNNPDVLDYFLGNISYDFPTCTRCTHVLRKIIQNNRVQCLKTLFKHGVSFKLSFNSLAAHGRFEMIQFCMDNRIVMFCSTQVAESFYNLERYQSSSDLSEWYNKLRNIITRK